MQIQQAISEVIRSKTLVVIAHRLKTIAGADQILVLDKGLIRERGRHAGLLEQGGLYAHLWQEQQRTGGWKFSKSPRARDGKSKEAAA